MAIRPDRLLTVHVMFLAGGAAILVDYLILRSPGQKGDKMPRVFKVGRTCTDALKEASPDALEEVERVKTGTQQPGKLAAHDQAHLGLIAGEQFPSRILVTILDPAQEHPDVVILAGVI